MRRDADNVPDQPIQNEPVLDSEAQRRQVGEHLEVGRLLPLFLCGLPALVTATVEHGGPLLAELGPYLRFLAVVVLRCCEALQGDELVAAPCGHTITLR